MKLQGDRVLILQEQKAGQTIGGIYIPETLQTARNIGKVIAIGDKVEEDLLGKDVMFHIQSAKDFELGNYVGKLVFSHDIIATL